MLTINGPGGQSTLDLVSRQERLHDTSEVHIGVKTWSVVIPALESRSVTATLTPDRIVIFEYVRTTPENGGNATVGLLFVS